MRQIQITFHPEETMTFIDPETKKPSTDKIDIAVWENILQSFWSGKTDDEIRFAIECKRIEQLSDASNYTSDMEKFCKRNHVNTRLPFEGQIAFIENRQTFSLFQSRRRTFRATCLQPYHRVTLNEGALTLETAVRRNRLKIESGGDFGVELQVY